MLDDDDDEDDDEDEDEAENGESVRPKVLTSREITQKSQTARHETCFHRSQQCRSCCEKHKKRKEKRKNT